MNNSSASRKECLWRERENLSRAQEVAEQECRVSTHGIPDHQNLVDFRLYEELSKTLNDFIYRIPCPSHAPVIPRLFMIPEEDPFHWEVLGKSKELKWWHAYLVINAAEQHKSDIPGLIQRRDKSGFSCERTL